MCDSIENKNPGEKYTHEQQIVFELFSKGYSFFLTGKGGCGKSFVLKGIIESVRKKLGPCAIAVTAPTGKSALNIGGKTIQSWAGVGLGQESRYQLCDKVLANEECIARWKKCQVIVIDEVSQLALDLFEKLEFIARRVRNNDTPFGGLQLIFGGDFYQLPPVIDGEKYEYCFQSLMWSKCIDFSIKLTQIIRQSQSEFLILLNEIRQGGCLSQFAIDLLNSLTRPLEWKDGETPLKLFPRKEEVQDENNKLLNLLPGETHVFNAIDGGKSKNQIDRKCPAPKTLLLKVGAPVMLIKNYPHLTGLVNGSLGTIIQFVNNYPQVRFENGQTIIVREYTWSVNDAGCYLTRRQLPLVLAWGMTIHKCQGQTLSKAEISMSNLFVPGQAYVALSRVKTLEGLRVLPGFDKHIPTISKHVQQFYQENVLPVSDVKCDNVIPIRMVITNHEDETWKLMDNEEPVSNDWRHILPLPGTIKADKILKDTVTDEMNSQETKKLMLDIGFDKETVPPMLLKFICHSWMVLEKMVAKPEVNEVVVVSKKNWVGYAGSLHKLKISTDLSNRWIEVLNSSELHVKHVEILSYEQRSVMAQLIDKLHAVLIDSIHQNLHADTDEVNTNHKEEAIQTNVHIFTKECQSKIRYMAGWALRKEISACNSYTNKNQSSKTKKVINRLRKEEQVKSVLKEFTTSESTLEAESKYQASLQYMQSHNRGGLTNVSDNFYECVLSVESACKQHFTLKLFHKHKWNSCKIGREAVRKDPAVKTAFNKLMSCVGSNNNSGSDVTGVVQQRILKRYLNMRCKEFVKVLKREMKYEKVKEHRKKVQEKKRKTTNGSKDIVRQLIEDTSTNKVVAFHTLKAIAAKGKGSFVQISKKEIHFICHLFGIKFKKSETKANLDLLLIKKINDAHDMTYSSKCTQQELNMIRDNKKCAMCDASREVLGTLSNITNVVNSSQPSTSSVAVTHTPLPTQGIHKPQPKVRRKQFKPDDAQKTILQMDSVNGISRELIEQRASEFGVDVSQIRSWHRRLKNKQRSSTCE